MKKLGLGLVVVPFLLVVACTGASSNSSEPQVQSRAPLVAAANDPDAPPVDPREARLAGAITALLEGQHLRHRTLDDALSRAAFATYLERLDFGKMFLLAEDATALGVYADQLDDELHTGDLEAARAGAAIFKRRVAAVDAFVAELLAAPLVAPADDVLETDPKKLQLAASVDELRERWRRRLTLEVLERVAGMEARVEALAKAARQPGHATPAARPTPADGDDPAAALSADAIPPTVEGREAKARADLAKAYGARFARLRTPGSLDAVADLINALTSVFDPHTNYLPPDDKANFDIQMSGKLEGIGAVLREDDHYIRVVELVPGGASWLHGELDAGDIILSVAQDGQAAVDVTDMPINDVVKMIRGPAQSRVTLSIQKPTSEVKVITITRDVVVIEESYARGAVVTPKGSKQAFGYIYLPSFYGGQSGQAGRSSAGDVARLLAEMQQRKLAGVVLDVRENGGGLLDDARVMTGLLIDQGPVVQTQEAGGERDVLADDEPGTTFSGSVVVMVDRGSASASEIVAGALQDYRRAVIVGTGPTHGKGTVQVLADLDRGSRGDAPLGVLKLTIQQFFRVSGASTQWKGVEPDVTLPDPFGFVESGERHLDHSLPYSEVAPLAHATWPASWKLDDLIARSKARVTRNPLFGKVIARTALLTRRREQTVVPVGVEAWRKLRAEQRAALEAVDPKLDESPARFAVSEIDYAGKGERTTRPGGKTDDRAARWREALSKDPWLDEALHVLGDMQRGAVAR